MGDKQPTEEVLRKTVELRALEQARDEKRQKDRSGRRDVSLDVPLVTFSTIMHRTQPQFSYKPVFDKFQGIDWQGMSIPLEKFKLAAQSVVAQVRKDRYLKVFKTVKSSNARLDQKKVFFYELSGLNHVGSRRQKRAPLKILMK